MEGPALFEVVTPATAGANRRLTTAATVRGLIGSPAGDDTVVDGIIDRACSLIAAHCQLARDLAGTPPNFGAESVRATWATLSDSGSRLGNGYGQISGRGTRLFLPWRVPIRAISSVVEDGTSLTLADDLKLMPGGLLERRSGGAPICWSPRTIVVTYDVGWALQTPGTVPPDLEGACIDQVKMMYFGRRRDPLVLREDVPDVHRVDYGGAGGNSIGDGGLLDSVEGALFPYINPAKR